MVGTKFETYFFNEETKESYTFPQNGGILKQSVRNNEDLAKLLIEEMKE